MSGWPARLARPLRRMPGYALLRLVWHALAPGDDRRESARLALFSPPGLFQPHGHTRPDRYPEIFASVREQVGDGPERHLLSFGCSDGEEVFSLRRLFPQAAIEGIDASRRRIATCRARLAEAGGDPAIAFSVATSADKLPASAYDAVFAMAVFRHGDLSHGPERCDHRIRFADFERATASLARCLKPGGLLVLRHAHFRFADTTAATDFTPLLQRPLFADTPLYAPNNHRLPGVTSETVVFAKKGKAFC